MEINWHEWIDLSAALLRAQAAFDDWRKAGDALSHALETSRLRSICNDYRIVAPRQYFLNYPDFHNRIGHTCSDLIEVVYGRRPVENWFWPGALTDWGDNSASVDRRGIRFSVSGIRVNKAEMDELLVAPEPADKLRRAAATRTVSEADLSRYLDEIADGKTPIKHLRAKAMEHFAPLEIPEKNLWRPAIQKLDTTKILPRARPKNK